MEEVSHRDRGEAIEDVVRLPRGESRGTEEVVEDALSRLCDPDVVVSALR